MTAAVPALRTLVVGDGRAGGAFHRALTDRGWQVEVIHHGELLADAGEDASTGGVTGDPELVLLCVPDGAVARCAGALEHSPQRIVAHCAGSLDLEVLAGHPRVASVHPLVSIPDAEVGAGRLIGAWFAVAGDPLIHRVVDALQGTAIEVPERTRGAYHAAAAVASNHLVAQLALVERIAAPCGVPLEAYLGLARGTIDNVAELGVAGALTGPAARGDWATVGEHLRAIGDDERGEYIAGMVATARLAGRVVPGEVLGGGATDDSGTGADPGSG